MMRILERPPRKLVISAAAAIVLGTAGLLQLSNANPAESQTIGLYAWGSGNDPGLDPASAAWNDHPPIQVPLTAQAGTYPAGGGTIPVVDAKALHYKNRLYVRLEWADSTQDASTTRVQDFADGAALEFPAKSATTVPAICMGQATAGVNIWHWRADSEAGPLAPGTVYANTQTDGYPAEFYTARDAGNPYAQLDRSPVQNLVAQAFGTLSTSGVQDIQGHGVWQNGRWSVVFTRDFTGAGGDLVSFAGSTPTDMAFAVWNGSQGDRNGQKSVSSFVTLSITDAGTPDGGTATWALVIGAIALIGLTALGFALAFIGIRQDGGPAWRR